MKNKNKQNLSLYRIDCMAWKGFFYTDLRLRCLKFKTKSKTKHQFILINKEKKELWSDCTGLPPQLTELEFSSEKVTNESHKNDD